MLLRLRLVVVVRIGVVGMCRLVVKGIWDFVGVWVGHCGQGWGIGIREKKCKLIEMGEDGWSDKKRENQYV